MAVPTIFSERSSKPIATYNYTDFSEGVGVVEFYAGQTKDSSSTKGRLDRNVFRPCGVYRSTRVACSDAAFTKKIDLDFDTSTLNIPKSLQGTFMATVPLTINGKWSDDNAQAYLVVNLIKVGTDGTTETNILTITSATIDNSGTLHDNKYITFTGQVPLTFINTGEKIRITVEVWGKWISGTSGVIGLMTAYDPYNAEVPAIGTASSSEYCTFAAGYTQMQFFVPFRIDL